MPHRLAMRADGAHRLGTNMGQRQEIAHHARIHHGQRIAGQCRAMQLVGAGCIERQQLRREIGVERPVGMRKNMDAARFATAERCKHAVDTVERGAGHQSDEEVHHGPIVPSG